MAPRTQAAQVEQPKTDSNGVILLPKITVKDVGSNPQAILAHPVGYAGKNMLMRCYGVVSGIKRKVLIDPDSGEKSEYEALMGDFRAINIEDNSPMFRQRYRSSLMYLPEGIHDLLASPVKLAAAQNEQAEITFGFDVYSRRTTSLAGYGYAADILGNAGEENEAIQRLVQTFVEETPRLEDQSI